MGEKSRKRGEFGEDVVERMLSLIGWSTLLKGRDFPCVRPMEHRVSTKGRVSHGIDFIFHYESLLYRDTQEFVLISSKYNDEYVSNPVRKFKPFLRDIADALACFKKSDLRNQLSVFQKSHKSYTGVIFWIDNGKENHYDDVIERLTDFRIDSDLEFESIYLVDNKRAGFLFDAIGFSYRFFHDAKVEFLIPNTGHNDTVKTRRTSSSILPVEYINTSVLPLKITQSSSEILVLNVIDGFEEDHLKRLISLAQNLTAGWGNQIHILFPSFNYDVHGEAVEKVKMEFRDLEFVQKITVGTFHEGFRNVT